MDTSESYIKMCEKAVEVQADEHSPFFHQFIVGDWYVELPDYNWGCVGIGDGDYLCRLHKANMPMKFIWLPLQHQLQGMVKRSDENARPFVARFAKWVHDEIDYVLMQQLISMEQLWLAFVMKEKYNKVWNGEEWV